MAKATNNSMRLGRLVRLALLAGLAIILIAIIAFLFNEDSSLRKELADRNAELASAHQNISALQKSIMLDERTINEKDADIANLTGALEDTHSRLNNTQIQLQYTISELNQTREELENKSLSLEQAKAQFSDLKTQIADFQTTLQESIIWFKDNSRLSPNLGYFAPYVRSNCVQEGQLNLACVTYMMEKRLGFHYISETTDQLHSLDEAVSRGGGDCKDYALFLRAVLNSVNDTTPSVDLLSWEPGYGKFIVYQSGDQEYYYNGDNVTLPKLGSINPEAFCYVTGYNAGVFDGHCIVALGEHAILDESDLPGLDGAKAFEPQDGGFKGTIGNDYHLCENGEMSCGTEPGDILVVMSDDDLYEFHDGEWRSYGTYSGRLTDFLAQIDIATGANSG